MKYQYGVKMGYYILIIRVKAKFYFVLNYYKPITSVSFFSL